MRPTHTSKQGSTSLQQRQRNQVSQLHHLEKIRNPKLTVLSNLLIVSHCHYIFELFPQSILYATKPLAASQPRSSKAEGAHEIIDKITSSRVNATNSSRARAHTPGRSRDQRHVQAINPSKNQSSRTKKTKESRISTTK